MVEEGKKEEEAKEEKIWKPDPPNCPKCGYPHAQPPECIACGEKIEDLPEEPAEKPEGETPEGEEPEEPEEIDELLKKTREELNMIAEEKELDPGDYANKEEIAKAILEAEE